MKKIFLCFSIICCLTNAAFAANKCIENIDKHADKINHRLIMDECDLHPKDMPTILSFLDNHKEFTRFSADHNYIGDEGVKILAKTSNLHEVILDQNQISNDGAIALAKNSSIQILYLFNNQISDNGAIALAKNNSLKKLNIGRNQIGDAGAISLANNTTLKELDVSYNHIGSVGLAALAENKTLEFLDIDGNEGTPPRAGKNTKIGHKIAENVN